MRDCCRDYRLGDVVTDDQLEILANKIFTKMHAERQSFWIDAEAHYNSHKDVSELVQDYKSAKGIFWKAFIGLAVIGALALGMLGLGAHK